MYAFVNYIICVVFIHFSVFMLHCILIHKIYMFIILFFSIQQLQRTCEELKLSIMKMAAMMIESLLLSEYESDFEIITTTSLAQLYYTREQSSSKE